MHPIVGIVNTNSRSPFSRKFLRTQLASIRAHPLGQHIQLLFTAQAGDAEKLTRRALEDGCETVLSIGGDGTHNEVVNGFFDRQGNLVRPKTCLAVFPGGTGGDFRKTLGIGNTASEALVALQSGRLRPIDIGRIRFRDRTGRPVRRYFINIASVGLSGLVDRYAADARFHRFGGKGAYALATLRAFLRFRNRWLRIHLDRKPAIVQRVCTLAAANGRFFGGGMKVAPRARVDDGLFDVVCLGDFALIDFLINGHRLYRGLHTAMAKVWIRRARRVRIESETPVPIDVDGEAAGFTPIEVSMASERIPVFAARERAFAPDRVRGQAS